MLYGDVIKSNINKKIADDLKNDWSGFKIALTNMDLLLKEMNIDISRFSSSWNVLLPILYYIYYNNEYINNVSGVRSYLTRAIMFNYFRSGTTGKLQQMKSNINSYNYDITIEMLDQISDLRVTDGKLEDVINSEKGSRIAGEVLYYISLNWINKAFKYEQDHLHPDSRFNSNKPINISVNDWKEWRGMRNRLPNLHLLEGRSNGSKNDMRLMDYYNDMNTGQQVDFCNAAMIPKNSSLQIEDFPTFYEERKALITQKIRELLG